MITALVQFPIPDGMPVEEMRQIIRDIAPEHQQPQGLVRKYYLLHEGERTTGGFYLWQTRDDAELFFRGLRSMIEERWDVTPTITYFETPIIIDNVAGEIVEAPKRSRGTLPS